MLSYTTSTGLLNSLSKVPSTDTTNTSLLVQFWNDSIRTIASIRGGKWPWLMGAPVTVPTVASQQGYEIPNVIRKIADLYITVGDVTYLPRPVFDPNLWKLILASNLGESDAALFYFVQGNKVLISPTPASSSNTIYFRGRRNLRDLSIADYTTGGILTLANGGTAVTGTGTTWTTSMAGRFIRITESDTANKGDGFWYEIASVASTTSLTLLKPYQGTAIATGNASYTIGQMSPIPEAYEMAPIYRALALFSRVNDPLHPDVSNNWWRMYDGGQEAGFSDEVGGLVGQMLQEAGETVEGAYISPEGFQYIDPNVPPRYPISGF